MNSVIHLQYLGLSTIDMAKEKTTGSNISMSSDSIPCDSHESPKPTTAVPTPKVPLPATPVPTSKSSIALNGTTTPEVLVPQSQSQIETCDEPVPTSQPEIEAALEAPKNRHLEHASPVEDSLKDLNRPQGLVEDSLKDPGTPRYLVGDSQKDPARTQEPVGDSNDPNRLQATIQDSLKDLNRLQESVEDSSEGPNHFQAPVEDSLKDPNRLQAPVEDSLKDPNRLQASVEEVQNNEDLSELGLGVETEVVQHSSQPVSQPPEAHGRSASPVTHSTAFEMPPKVSGKSGVAPSMAPRPTSAKPKASHYEPASRPKASGGGHISASVTAPLAVSSKQALQDMRIQRNAATSQQNTSGTPGQISTSLNAPKAGVKLGSNAMTKSSVSTGTFKPPASLLDLSSRTSALSANPSKQPVASRQQTKATTSQPATVTKPMLSDQTAVFKTSSRPPNVKQAAASAKKSTGPPTAVMEQSITQAKAKVTALPTTSSTVQAKPGSLSSVKKPPSEFGAVAGSTNLTKPKRKVADIAADERDDFNVPTSPRKRPGRPRKSQAAPPKPKSAATQGKNTVTAKKSKAVVDLEDDDDSDDDADDPDDEGYHSKSVKVPTAGARTTRASRRGGPLLELDLNNRKGTQRQAEKGSEQTHEDEDGVQEQPVVQGLSKKTKTESNQRHNARASLPQSHQDESIEEFEQSMTNIHDANDSETAGIDKRQEHEHSTLNSAEAEAVVQTKTTTTTMMVKETYTAAQEPKTGKTQDDPVVVSETPSGDSDLSDISSDEGEDVAKHDDKPDLPAKKPTPYTPFKSSPPLSRQKNAQDRGHLKEKDLRIAERKDAIQKPHLIGFDRYGPKNQGTLPTKDFSRSSVQNRSLDATKYDKSSNAPRQSGPTNDAVDAMEDIITGSIKGHPPTYGDTTVVDDDIARYHDDEDQPSAVVGFHREDRLAKENAEEEPEQVEPIADAGEEVHEQGQPFSDFEHGGLITGLEHKEPSPRSERPLTAMSMPPPRPKSWLVTTSGYEKRQIGGDLDQPMSGFLERPQGVEAHSADVASKVATTRLNPPAVSLAARSVRHNAVQPGSGYKRSDPMDDEGEKKDVPVKRPKTAAEGPEDVLPTMRTKDVVVDERQTIPANHKAFVTEKKAGVTRGEPQVPTKPSESPTRAAKTSDGGQQPSLGNSMLKPTKQETSARSQQRGLPQPVLIQAKKEPEMLRGNTMAQAVRDKHHTPGNDVIPRKSERNKIHFNQVQAIASIPKPTAVPKRAIEDEKYVSTHQVIGAQRSERVATPVKPRIDIPTQKVSAKDNASQTPLPSHVAVSIQAKTGVKRHTDASHDEPSKRTRVAEPNKSQPPLHGFPSGKVNPPRRLPQRRITEEGSPVRSEQEKVYSQQQNSEAASDGGSAAPETHGAYFHDAPIKGATKNQDDNERFEIGMEMAVDEDTTSFVHDEVVMGENISRFAERGEESQAMSEAGFGHGSDGYVVTNIDPLTHAGEDPFISTQEEMEAEHDQSQADGHSFLSRLKFNARFKAHGQDQQAEEQVDHDDDVEQEAGNEGEEEEEEAEDPDKTLVEDDYAFMPDGDDDGSSQSSEEPDGRKVQFADDFEARMRTLRPYQHDFHHGLFRLAHELSRHLIKAEDAVLDLVQDYHKDCMTMIEETESSHGLRLVEFFDDALKKQYNLSRGFEAAAKKLDKEAGEVELSHEEYSKTHKGKKNPVNELNRLLQGIV